MSPRIYYIACKIYHHLEVRGKGNFNCCLDLVVYDDSIGITIEDNCSICTFLIDTFSDYITIFHSLPHLFLLSMANFNNITRCYPFSSKFYVGRKYCCTQMNLVSALNHSFKCLTCLMQRDALVGVSPIFPPNKCAHEHIAKQSYYILFDLPI